MFYSEAAEAGLLNN